MTARTSRSSRSTTSPTSRAARGEPFQTLSYEPSDVNVDVARVRRAGAVARVDIDVVDAGATRGGHCPGRSAAATENLLRFDVASSGAQFVPSPLTTLVILACER